MTEDNMEPRSSSDEIDGDDVLFLGKGGQEEIENAPKMRSTVHN